VAKKMKIVRKQFGMTLIETTVTVAIVSLLAVLSTPSIRAYFDALGSPAEVKGAISAAFASARAIAAKEQHYAGVRFQQDSSGKQYMIFIVNDPAIGAYFFRAAEGFKPIKLPENIGVMDFTIVTGRKTGNANPANPDKQERLDDSTLSDNYKDGLINNSSVGLTDVTTFSIIFSPAGKLVIHGIWVRNRDDYTPSSSNSSLDDVFNTQANVTDPVNPVGMFIQDDYWGNGTNPDLGLGPEPSRNSFVIYETDKFKDAYKKGVPYSEYLKQLDVIYTNPYTGTIIQGN